jgi:hypothetical protein
MPLYEFYCPGNHRIYTFLARSTALAGRVPRCPDNPAWTLRKRVSRFAFIGRAKEPAGDPAGEADDPRMEAAMREMEREMAGLDESNPDPRQLARLVRRMGELTGEPPDEAAREMIGRLEAGEDPDRLEEEFGDAFDGGNDDEGPPAEPAAPGGHGAARRALARLRPPQRDPRVHEMADWM